VTRAPAVELLFWEGCPSHPEALAQLRDVLRSEDVGSAVELVEVTSDEQAQRERFPGSPTIRIDGEDILPPGDAEPFSLTCRVYQTRDGRVSAVPDPEDVREAVRRAAG
jgi:hypothetical protein